MTTPALASLTDRTPRRCQCCERTALWGTAGHDAAVDPANCPRCDASYAAALAGGRVFFDARNDSPVFVTPTPTAFSRTVSPLARRVAIYAAAAQPDARDADLPSLTGRDLAAMGLELLERRDPEAAHRAARIVRAELGVSL